MLKLSDRSTRGEFDDHEAFLVSDEPESTPAQGPETTAKAILAEAMRFRRFAGPASDCAAAGCPRCLAPHLAKVVSAVALGLPVTFVLPAFPGKSPNPAKVLGTLPDMAERRALEFLQHLCDRLRDLYAPGARVILCSDGRVFSDAVGMRDADVTAYQDELSRMIAGSNLASISTFNLDELYDGVSFDGMRERLMEQHGDSLDALRSAVGRGGKSPDATIEEKECHRLYLGITRFLVEDATFPGQTRSRTALQKEARVRAYEVIARSRAWGDLVELRFPNAVRLSIHPQGCGDRKLGIRLIEPDHWLTPWHGVAAEVDGRFILLKRAEAEALGGRLVHRDGRPSHYVLERTPAKILGASHAN
ncbi:MAG: isocyanide synthase family protein [Bdellovibrionales bacterium]|nr:isocyanide synthase family protein [Bdellovibrionales bacterium]